ncbi:hypothetical protein [Pseudomonas mangiferae]|uniref:hypothetical protein n=1 Tax=Pseudomonas mangiferae TaxID=2593654 RepID=UPI0015B3F120|nr:hypothetical protein [Pseudomonas mangiferae]
MSKSRSLGIVLAALLLGACERETPAPPSPPPGAPTAPKVTEAKPASSAPAPATRETPAPSPPRPPVAAKPAETTRPETPAKPAAAPVPQRPAQVTEVTPPADADEDDDADDAPKPKPARKVADAVRKANPAPSKAATETLPDVKLDLHLPSDAVKQLDTAHKSARKPAKGAHEEALLPPMFVERRPSSPFQLNGRLITKEREDAVEGAELRFEFKQ